jgi:3D (Asp-Asp-Asp) domain-containing protein
MKEPLTAEQERASMMSGGTASAGAQPSARTIGGQPPPEPSEPGAGGGGGRVLGRFRNTYYDFPNEADHNGAKVSLMNASCQPIAEVPKGFYDTVCVQGSGSLARGGTVSFAKRDCTCAEVCPRTGQRICFEALDKTTFPWGRGAAGVPIAPLRSVAADTRVLPMGTVLYIPELDGVSRSDGCFVVEDRGLRVQGEHVDIFTGMPAETATLNAAVPSNQGVTIVLDAPKCGHLARR